MIEAQDLVKRYGSTTAVKDLSFSVRPGMVTGFLGPNGAGKTNRIPRSRVDEVLRNVGLGDPLTAFDHWVETMGLEPTTPCVQSRCSSH
jgi:ABC-type polar amino acid transport system ATPase subunit